MKIIYFSKTIVAYDLKVRRCIELKNFMNLHEYQRSRSFFEFSPKVTQFWKLNLFFSKTVEVFETKYTVKEFGSTEMKIYTNDLVT